MKIRTKDDLIVLLKEFNPNHKITNANSAVTTVMRLNDADVKLTTNTTSKTKRDIILDGLERLRKIEEHGRENDTFKKLIDMHHPVDDDIAILMGAKRKGLNIVWELTSGTYVYDMFVHSLERR